MQIMKRILITLILINFTFIVNEVVVFGQEFESWGMKAEVQVLNKYKAELQSSSIWDSTIESQRDYIGQALSSVTDSICPFDAEDLNDRYTKLDEAVRAYQKNQSAAAEKNIKNTEIRLRADLIKAIDSALRTNFKCDGPVHVNQAMMESI